jgi:hypothetical protein
MVCIFGQAIYSKFEEDYIDNCTFILRFFCIISEYTVFQYLNRYEQMLHI